MLKEIISRLGRRRTHAASALAALALLVGSLVLLVSVAAVRLSVKSGLPSLLLYLAIGLAIGESGLGIDFDNAELTQVLGYAALILILTEGGLSTKWAGIKDSVAPAAVLSTIGVVVSVVLGLVALLLGGGTFLLGSAAAGIPEARRCLEYVQWQGRWFRDALREVVGS